MAKKKGTSGGGCFSRLLWGGVFLVVVAILAAAGLVVAKPVAVRDFLRPFIQVKPLRAELDLEALVQEKARAKITLEVNNRLPLGATMEDLKYNVFLNDRLLASGLQTLPRLAIPALAKTPVAVTFEVDGNKARSALLATAQKQAQAVVSSVLDQLKGKPRPLPSPKGMLRIVGQAKIRLLIGDLELPLDHGIEFERKK